MFTGAWLGTRELARGLRSLMCRGQVASFLEKPVDLFRSSLPDLKPVCFKLSLSLTLEAGTILVNARCASGVPWQSRHLALNEVALLACASSLPAFWTLLTLSGKMGRVRTGSCRPWAVEFGWITLPSLSAIYC